MSAGNSLHARFKPLILHITGSLARPLHTGCGMDVDLSSHGVSRAGPLFIAIALLAVVVGAVGIASIAGFIPGATTKPKPQPAMAVPVDTHTKAKAIGIECNACGTVSMIRTFELRDGVVPAGAAAGGSAERSPAKRFVYRVTVHMDDGSYRTFSQSDPPAFGVGAKVKVVKGAPARRT